MGLRFDPVGGGQLKNTVKQLIEIERQPIRALEARKAIEETKMKLFGEFKSKFTGLDGALGLLTSFKNFRELKAERGEGDKLMSVTIDKEKADPGTYEIQIDQLARRSSAISGGYEDAEKAIVGMGYIVFDRPDGETWEVFVDEEQASLNGIAKMINQDKRSPVRAAIVKDAYDTERPFKMIITAKNDGLDDEVIFPQFYFMDGVEDFYMEDERDAQNARITIDGFPIDIESNQVPDFLPGVNVFLKSAREDEPFMLTITEDYEKIAGKVKGLVENINGVLEFIYKQNAVDERTDTRATFAGDSGLQIIEHKIRNVFHEGYPVYGLNEDEERGFMLIQLSQIGLGFERNGQVKFDEKKFQTALERDFAAVSEAITGPDGFANRMKGAVSGYTRTGDGLLGVKEQGLRARIKQIDNQIEQKQRVVARKEQSLTEQFSRLQASLSTMQRQQQYLTATLGGGGGGDLLGQLLNTGG